jgi:hypothetical protein
MQISTIKKIGKTNYTFTGAGNNVYEAITELGKASFGNIEKCGICESDNLVLASHTAKGFTYTEIKCLKCKGSLTLGQRKENKDVSFLRRGDDGKYDWKAYVPSEK